MATPVIVHASNPSTEGAWPPSFLSVEKSGAPQFAAHLYENLYLVDNKPLEIFLDSLVSELRAAAQRISGIRIREFDIKVCDANSYAGVLLKKRPLIVVDINLLKNLESIDELAFIIGHEIGHTLYRAQKFNGRLGRNHQCSVIEEEAADRLGQQIAQEAGYSRLGAPKFFEDLIKARDTREYSSVRGLFNILDVHLDDHTRWSNLKNDYIGIQRLREADETLGTNDLPLTPFPEALKEEASKLSHQSHFERRRAESNYDEMNVSEKLEFLVSSYSEVTNHARLLDFNRMVQDFTYRSNDRRLAEEDIAPIRAHVPEYLERIERATNKLKKIGLYGILDSNYSLYHFFLSCSNRIHQGDSLPALGKYRVLEEAVRKFDSANTLSDARRAAGEYLGNEKLIEQFRLMYRHSREFGGPKLYVPSSFSIESIIQSPKLLQWIEEDNSGTIFRFITNGQWRVYKWIPLFDELSIPALERECARKGRRHGAHDGLPHYLAARKKLADCTFPPPIPLIPKELKAWSEKYELFLSCSRIYSNDEMSQFHPYFGKSAKEIRRIYNGTWAILAKALHAHLNSLDFDGKKAFVEEYGSFIQSLPSKQSLNEYDYKKKKCIYHPSLLFIKRCCQEGLVSDQEKWRLIRVLGGQIHPIDLCEDILKLALPDKLEKVPEFVGVSSTWRKSKHHNTEFRPSLDEHFESLAEALTLRLGHRDLNDQNSHPEDLRGDLASCIALFKAVANRRRGRTGILDLADEAFFGAYKKSHDTNDLAFQAHSPFDVVQTYRWLNAHNLFPDETSRRCWGNMLIEQIDSVANVDERRVILLHSISRESFSGEIQDLNTLSTVISMLSDLIAKEHGLDDGTDEFHERLIASLNGSSLIDSFEIPEYTAFEIISQVGDKVCAQRSLAFALREKAAKKDETDVLKSLPIKGGEWFLNSISRNDLGTKNLFIFLTSPGDRGSTENFRTRIYDGELGRDCSDMLRKAALGIPPNADHWDVEQEHKTYSEEQVTQLECQFLKDLHAAFWGQRFDIRTLAIKHLLLNPRDLMKDEVGAFQKASETVLDRLLPLDRAAKGSREEKSIRWSRIFIQTFLEVAHESERPFLLSAMASAAQVFDEGAGSFSVGKQLREILVALGPAYIKLGQAIHSHPRTPDDIKEELADLKGYVNVPRRWDLWTHYDETVPESKQHEIAWVGPVRGAASFNVVFEIRTSSGAEDAMSLLRRYALQQGLKGFSNLKTVTMKLAEVHAEVRPAKSQILEILSQAEVLTHVECDSTIGAAQSAVQFEQYEGIEIAIGGQTIRFNPTRLIDYGDGWRHMSLARGVWFDVLPEVSIEEKNLKAAHAGSILLVELVNLLRGQQIDYDRHARQYLIEDSINSPVDYGGMSLEGPSDEDKRLLARVVFDVAKDVLGEGQDLNKSLAHVVTLESDNDYIQRVKRLFLSLSFTFEHLSPSELRKIFNVAIHSEFVDRAFRDEFRKLSLRHGLSLGTKSLLRSAFRETSDNVREISVVRKNIDRF